MTQVYRCVVSIVYLLHDTHDQSGNVSPSLCRWDQQWKQFRYLNDLNRNYITPAICLGVLQQCLHLLKFFPRPFRQVFEQATSTKNG